jgi:PAS domain S-box-containing protein
VTDRPNSGSERRASTSPLGAPYPDDEADRARSELAIEAAGIGSFDWDLVTGRLQWDERLLELFGYDAHDFDESIEAFNERLHPDDVARVAAALEGSISNCGDFEAEYRIVRPSGELRWVQARGRALCDEAGRAVRLLGAAYDTTAVREGEARVARLLESMSAAFFLLDRNYRFAYVNAEAERVLASSRQQLLGGSIWELFPLAVGSEFELYYTRSMETGVPSTFEAYYPAPLDAWYEVRALPGPDGLSVYFLDITARRRAEERAERAAERATLLARVTADLTGTLDAQEAVGRLARLVVPALSDWCIVTLLDDNLPGAPWQRLRDIGSWHTDPERRALVQRYASSRLPALDESSFLAQALLTGRPAVVRAVDTTAAVAAVLQPGEARDALRQLRPQAVAVVPLRARGRTLGLLTLAHDGGSSRSEIDLRTSTEVAERAGLALDNVRLYEQQRRMAERLQRSLLTGPPKPDHLQVEVRYEPAAEAAQVGGDWYDAFLQAQGTTMLVIGDVVGHDAEAAAAMGQVRGLLRGIAATTGEGPAAVLTRLDRAMELLQVETTATVVIARFEQTAEQRAAGVTSCRWSNAGHPSPIVLRPDGTTASLTELSDAGPDLLLGIDPDTDRGEFEVLLERGSTIVLYTDGLVERRDRSIDEGIGRLCEVLADLADRPLAEVCDTLLDRLLPASPDDDVALAAVRLHPQDRPRPAVAGPRDVPASVPPEQG